MTAMVIGSRTSAGTRKDAAEARRWVASLVRRHPRRDDIELLASEIIGNAVLHSDSREPGGKVTVTVIEAGPRIRVEVVDGGSVLNAPEVKAEVFTDNGHGLFLVKTLAADWGNYTDHSGRCVWFEVGPS